MAIFPFRPYRPMAGKGTQPKVPDVPVAPAAVAEEFHFFWSGPFSNWYKRDFVVDDIVYNCNEQFMMAEKGRLFGDLACVERIMNEREPKIQKAIGRDVTPWDEDKWVAARMDIVAMGCFHKFDQHEDLRVNLLSKEGKYLVEASPHDRIWGIGLRESDPRARVRSKWLGLNLLGEVLTERTLPAIAEKYAVACRP
jgi:ribA/ribD-fused uncharacterized protein